MNVKISLKYDKSKLSLLLKIKKIIEIWNLKKSGNEKIIIPLSQLSSQKQFKNSLIKNFS